MYSCQPPSRTPVMVGSRQGLSRPTALSGSGRLAYIDGQFSEQSMCGSTSAARSSCTGSGPLVQLLNSGGGRRTRRPIGTPSQLLDSGGAKTCTPVRVGWPPEESAAGRSRRPQPPVRVACGVADKYLTEVCNPQQLEIKYRRPPQILRARNKKSSLQPRAHTIQPWPV